MRVLIVGNGFSRSSLGAVRAFGSAGWTVGVGSPDRGSVAASSKFAAKWHHVPPPERGLEAFLEATNDAIHNGSYLIVFGTGDAEVLALSARRHKVDAVVPHSSHESVMCAFDKLSLTHAAQSSGVPVPSTQVAINGIVPETVPLPVIVKGRMHWSPDKQDAPSRLEASLCRSRQEIVTQITRIQRASAEALLQPYITGEALDLIVLVDRNQRVVAHLQQRVSRLFPPFVGVNARAETDPTDPALLSSAERLLRALGWFGLAQLQFRRDKSGVARLIDLNGRSYNSLALALTAGINFPVAWAELALAGACTSRLSPHYGVRFQWLEGDIRRAFIERRKGLVIDTADSIGFALSAAHSVWSHEDPLPALRQTGVLVGRTWHKMASRLRS
jgi:predicted ATP-grasp superfamily ATP-dependent carboligase